MSELRCGVAREWIPDGVAGRLAGDEDRALRAHVGTCTECLAELRLAEMLRATRPVSPPDLSRRVSAAVRRDGAGGRRPWWGLTAAAVAALALGVGLGSRPNDRVAQEVPGYAYEVEEGTFWSSDDGLLAGAPLLQELSDEALERLLDDLTVGSSGGSA